MAKVEVVMDERTLIARHMLNLRLVKLSWALFFILIGGSWILEGIGRIDNAQKWALIYAGSGAILLLLNLLRIIWRLNISSLTVGLGVLGLLLGLTNYYTSGGFSIWAAIILAIGVFMLFEVLGR